MSRQNSTASARANRGGEDLPYGWEKVDDPQYGSYYVDHINKRTQYEKPFIVSSKSRRSSSGLFVRGCRR
ncbi:unnamed protein product [Soboliphyme baturini]|uniref:WW domain-containing protein n=1 Tax=Soboliphyme baturini TaxID=241478 RepID=A0A183IAF2_9BILA|nr:unnamed protein product [Soboliphyme baturini]